MLSFETTKIMHENILPQKLPAMWYLVPVLDAVYDIEPPPRIHMSLVI